MKKVEFQKFLEEVRRSSKLDQKRQEDVLRELYSHLEEKAEELSQAGVTPEKAARLAVRSLGAPQLLGQAFYQTYSGGGWGQSLVAAVPHFLCAFIFLLQLWANPWWLLSLFLVTALVSGYGWWHGRPPWLFPWLGYFLLPVLGVGFFLVTLSSWSYLAFIAYIPLAWKLFSTVTVQAARRDWLYASLVLLPFPVFSGWLLLLRLNSSTENSLQSSLVQAAPWIALSFSVLGLAVISFIRFSQRRLKTGVLLTPELAILLLVALGFRHLLGLPGLVLLPLLALAFLLSPLLLERRLGGNRGWEGPDLGGDSWPR